MLWVALVVAVVVAALAIAEPLVRERGIQLAADRTAEALGADVELHVVGRPVLWHLARRELPHVTVVAHDLPVLEGQAVLDRLRVELDTVRLRGRGDQMFATAVAGRFRLALGQEQLLAMVSLPGYLSTLEITPRGLRLWTRAGVPIDATVRLETDRLLVEPAHSMLRLLPQPSFWLPLPTWPYGALLEGIVLHEGSLDAWGVLAAEELSFPASPPWRRTTRAAVGDDGRDRAGGRRV